MTGSKAGLPTCFIAMPVATRPTDAERYDDNDHWLHVMESLFVKSVEAAGYRAIKPVAQGSHLIHGQIIRHLSQSDLVLCDLSGHNPNVFFELGVRTSLNLPIALVRDEHTELPFDTSGINTYSYNSSLRGWEIEKQRESLTSHIAESARSCSGENPLWRQFGLTIRAQEPKADESPLEAKVDLVMDRLAGIQSHIDRSQRQSGIDSEREALRELLESQAYDRHSTPQSSLFADAVRRFTRGKNFTAEVLREGPDRAAVRLRGNWTPDAVRRVKELADKYVIEATFFPSYEDARGSKRAERASQLYRESN